MKTFLYLCDWTAPTVLGPHQTEATGQVKLIRDAVTKGMVTGSGFAFPQHRSKPATNGILVFCPEENYDALVKIADIKLLHETNLTESKIAAIAGMSAMACVCIDGRRQFTRRAMLKTLCLGALAMGTARVFAPIGKGDPTTDDVVSAADKTALVSYLSAKGYDKDATLSVSVKAAWTPTEIAKVIEQAKITDTKVLAYETMKSPLFGWLDQTCRNVGIA
jgi:hypothetical protein